MQSALATMLSPVLAADDFLWFHFIPGFEDLNARIAAAFPAFPANENLPLYAHEATSAIPLLLALTSSAILITLCLITAASWKRREQAEIPESRFSVANAIETILDGCIGLGTQVFGSKKLALRYLPIIGTLALFIFFGNVLALLPGLAPPTDALSLTVAPALVVFFLTHYYGLRENGIHHITHLFGPMLLSGPFKWWWVFVLPPLIAFHALFFVIECISHLARPVSLALRLMGNMTGDHKVFVIFLGFVTWPFIYPVPVYFIATIVVTVQTVVFAVLSMVYISLAIEHSEEAH